ncbi:MAG: oligosaccharide flippase family protein [Chitinophagales bacterium]|nr:oligosaccharide flippase family protein [Chitinophagales bacterium]
MKKIIQHIKQLQFYNTLRHGSVYMLSFVVVQAVMVLSIPIFTKLLTPADFGIYEVYNNTVRFLAVIISVNLYTGFYRFYFEENISKNALMQFLLRTALLSFIIGLAVLLLLQSQVLKITGLPSNLFWWIPIGIFSTIIFNFFATYNNAQQYSTRAGIWQLVSQIGRVLLAIIFVIYISRDYYGRIAGENILLLIASLLIIIIYFRNYIGLKEQLPAKKEILIYAAGFIPIGLSSYIVSYVDLVLINNMQGSTASGVYSYAYKFAVIYSGFSQAFVTANRPNLFNLLNENKSEEVITQMRSMFKLITVLSVVFILFAGDAGRILSLKPEFEHALHLLPVLVLAYVFSDMAEVYNFFLHYSKKVKLFYVSFITTAVINFTLNYYLIPIYGYEVAAYTTLFSFMVLFATTYLVCKFYTQLSVPRWTVFLESIILIAAMALISFVLPEFIQQLYLLIATKIILFLILVIYVFYDKIIQVKSLLKP